MQWIWRLLFSGLLCVPAIFMLVGGTWRDSAVPLLDMPDSASVQQSYASGAASPTISLPRPTPPQEPVATTPDIWDLPPSTPVLAAAAPQRSRTPRRLELWYAAAPRQETPKPVHWALTHRPPLWVPAANQDGGG